MKPKKMTISRFAAAAQVGVETVRFYHREGLLPVPSIRGTEYREYNEILLKQLKFIRRAQTAGFSLTEIKQLIHFNPMTQRKQIQDLTQSRLTEINEKINELQNIAKAMNQLLQNCRHVRTGGLCPIIEAFSNLDH
jgi:MerR family transcriptional regulator, mercuric resistance operon regulatory protein